MAVTLTAGAVRTALGQLGDVKAAWDAKLANVPDNEVVVEDFLIDAAQLAGGPWAVAAPTLVPLIVPLIGEIVTQNESAQPGALPRIASGRKGSDPWET